MNTILSVEHIVKSYGPIPALKGISLQIPEGSVFGILGPNGSGKTTLLAILLDVLRQDAGKYEWFGGIPAHEARKQIGSLLETPNFYPYMSAYDNLAITAKVRGLTADRRDEVLAMLGLLERKHSLFRTFSLGMKQRLALAAALLGTPKVLVLDEPTNGLDPVGIAEIRNLILELNQQGITVIMASHILDEVEKVCTHVAILKSGTLLIQGAVDDILRSEDVFELSAHDMQALENIVQNMPGLRKIEKKKDLLVVYPDENVTPAMINEYCFSHGMVLTHLVLKKNSLERRFMEITEKA